MDTKKIREILKFGLGPVKELKDSQRLRENRIYYSFLKNKSVQKNTFLLESYHAVSMTGNVYAIFKKLAALNPSGKYYWVSDNKNDPMGAYLKEFSNKVKIILYQSREYYKLLATCEFLINDTSFMPYFIKRDDQVYINTWHGTPLKTLGKDIKNVGITSHKNIQRNLLHTDILFMPNEFTADKMINAYDLGGIYKGKVAITGNARVDSNFLDVESIRLKYKLPDRKIILYAPTWKKSIQETTEEDIHDLLAQVERIQKTVGDEYKVMLKAHYFIYQKFLELGNGDKIVPNWVDTNELLSCVDRLITDYSSIFFDFLPLKRPIYFYIPDRDIYEEERGFYLDIDSLPGVVGTTIEEIIDSQKLSDVDYQNKYQVEISAYLAQFCGEDDGQASERCAGIILGHNVDVKIKSYKADKKVILMYGGGMHNNGITTSLINLSKFIDYTKYELVILETERITAEKRNNLLKLDPRCKLIYRFSYGFRTLLDTYNQNLFYRQGYASKFINKEKLKQSMEYELKRLIGNLNPDIVIDYGGYNKVFAALFAFSSVKNKIMFLHSIMSEEFDKKIGNKYKHRWNLKVLFSIYPLFDQVISVSKSANQRNTQELFDYLKDVKTDYLYNLVDGDQIKSQSEIYKKINGGRPIQTEFDTEPRLPYSEVLDQFGRLTISAVKAPDKNFTNFVTVGRLSPEKNHLALLDAFAEVYKANPQTRLNIVGNGPLWNEINKRIIELRLHTAVTMYGFLDNPMPIVHLCDCFLMFSNYEAQGLSLVEAMVLNKAVLGTKVTGIQDVLEYYPELLVENNHESMVHAMKNFALLNKKSMDFDYRNYNRNILDKFDQLMEIVK